VLVVDASNFHVQCATFIIDRDRDVSSHEVNLVLGLQAHVVMEVSWSTQTLEDGSNPVGQGLELLLLALNNHQSATLTYLEQEKPGAYFAADPDHHFVRLVKFKIHEGVSSWRDEVELTLRTMGVEPVKASALTEQVEMTVRWKRSRGTPWA
jgi:hypothetical protein